MAQAEAREGWRPLVVCFACRHAFYRGTEAAGDAKIIEVSCAGRVTSEMVLRAFYRGADAVLVAGCAPSECRCSTGAYQACRRLPLLGQLLAFTGLEEERFATVWPGRGETGRFTEAVRALATRAATLGLSTRLREEL